MTFKEMIYKGLCDESIKIINSPMMIVLHVRLVSFGFILLEESTKI